jgi:hypothetical protein
MTETNIKVLARDRVAPAPLNQGEYGPLRTDRYGGAITTPLHSKVYALADEGNYFLATNPTMGTGIAGIAASTSYDATESLLHLRNVSTTKRLYLDFIELSVTAAGSSGTTTGFTLSADRGASRVGTGGSSITPKNVNMASSETADCTLQFGAVASGAASADVRLLGNFLVRSVIKVVGDKYRFTFGDSGAAWGLAGAAMEGTTIAAITIPCPPVVLGENDQFLLSDWGASQSGASSYEFRIGFWMR